MDSASGFRAGRKNKEADPGTRSLFSLKYSAVFCTRECILKHARSIQSYSTRTVSAYQYGLSLFFYKPDDSENLPTDSEVERPSPELRAESRWSELQLGVSQGRFSSDFLPPTIDDIVGNDQIPFGY